MGLANVVVKRQKGQDFQNATGLRGTPQRGPARAAWRARLLLCDAFQHLGGVAFGMDGGPNFLDFAGFSDEERAAYDAHEFAAHELLLLPGAVGRDGFVVGIAQQREIELVLGLERGLGSDGISAHAEDGDLALIELLFCVTKLGRFDGSTGSVGFRKEEEQDAPALKVFQRDAFVFVGLEPEARGFVAGLEHEKFPFTSVGPSVRIRLHWIIRLRWSIH